jgi:hypothetical protein
MAGRTCADLMAQWPTFDETALTRPWSWVAVS